MSISQELAGAFLVLCVIGTLGFFAVMCTVWLVDKITEWWMR
jgi:hypothetical protein